MATLTKATSPTPTLVTMNPPNSCRVGSNLRAGENLAAGDLVYIKGADGLVYKSVGTSAAAAICQGIVIHAAKVAQDDGVTIYTDIDIAYAASGLTPGATLWVSAATAGAIDDATSTNCTTPVGYVIDATRIRIHGTRQ